MLGIKLNEVAVFGIDISKSKELMVFSLATALSVYWLMITVVWWWRDRGIQAERRNIFDEWWGSLKRNYEENRRFIDAAPDRAAAATSVHGWTGIRDAYERGVNQIQRTRSIRWGEKIIGAFEVFVPLTFGCAALVILTCAISQALF